MDRVRPDLMDEASSKLLEQRKIMVLEAKDYATRMNDSYRKLGLRYHCVPVALRSVLGAEACKASFNPQDGCPRFARYLQSYTDSVDISKRELFNTLPEVTIAFLQRKVSERRLLYYQLGLLDAQIRSLMKTWLSINHGQRQSVRETEEQRAYRLSILAKWARFTQDVRQGIAIGAVEDTEEDILKFFLPEDEVDLDREANMDVVEPDDFVDQEDDGDGGDDEEEDRVEDVVSDEEEIHGW